ncbi:hypothetical protein SAMN06296065_102484 [Novosphingobium panipatense]|uniref:Uncharacterized protein n=1 Tax=Novosphingobium panipatense TaxID=428991 RepID=A0ABY1Q7Y2_9SPHN|nr:hypothetical protein SAMN06296065_102484 [Novosphingobium panipatense]
MAAVEPHKIMSGLGRLYTAIRAERRRRALGKFQSVNDAIRLQQLQREATKLRLQLPPLRLVS